MTVRARTITIAILLPALSFFMAAALLSKKPAPPAQQPVRQLSKFETKQGDEGDVIVAVTPKSMTIGKPASFTMSLDTHTVALEFDIPTIASLTDDQGNTLGTATWEGTGPGGHHRNGTLIFSTGIPQTKTITLTLANISGIAKRTFVWEVNK
jgi:predicted small integral membrane protein